MADSGPLASRCRLTVSGLLLREMLHLPQHAEITGGCFVGGVLTLELDVPDAPPGAATMEPQYTRAAGWPDPLVLTGITWRDAEGTEITAPAAVA